MTYQVFAQLIELRSRPLPPIYLSIFPPLLNPMFWERSGNIPALVLLVQVGLTLFIHTSLPSFSFSSPDLPCPALPCHVIHTSPAPRLSSQRRGMRLSRAAISSLYSESSRSSSPQRHTTTKGSTSSLLSSATTTTSYPSRRLINTSQPSGSFSSQGSRPQRPTSLSAALSGFLQSSL